VQRKRRFKRLREETPESGFLKRPSINERHSFCSKRTGVTPNCKAVENKPPGGWLNCFGRSGPGTTRPRLVLNSEQNSNSLLRLHSSRLSCRVHVETFDVRNAKAD
jgi:hypothetical protein